MQNEKDVDEKPDSPLINLEKWAHLKEKAMSALQYRDVRFPFDGGDGRAAMSYLKKCLQDIRVGEDFNQILQANSKKLAKNETLAKDEVKEAANRAGFG
jgi:hypothetical protein